MTLRRDTIVTVLALLAIAIGLPFAIVDTFQTGRVYVFSRQFIEELPQRFPGSGRFRFILTRSIRAAIQADSRVLARD